MCPGGKKTAQTGQKKEYNVDTQVYEDVSVGEDSRTTYPRKLRMVNLMIDGTQDPQRHEALKSESQRDRAKIAYGNKT
jgi:hypothetical protein